MTYGGNNFNDFPENRLFRAVQTVLRQFRYAMLCYDPPESELGAQSAWCPYTPDWGACALPSSPFPLCSADDAEIAQTSIKANSVRIRNRDPEDFQNLVWSFLSMDISIYNDVLTKKDPVSSFTRSC